MWGDAGKSNFTSIHFGGEGALLPSVGYCGLLIYEVSRSHTMHCRWYDDSGQVTSSLQRPLPDKTQHSQETDFHAPRRIQTHNLSRWVAVDLHLRMHDHWDQLCVHSGHLFVVKYFTGEEDVKHHICMDRKSFDSSTCGSF